MGRLFGNHAQWANGYLAQKIAAAFWMFISGETELLAVAATGISALVTLVG